MNKINEFIIQILAGQLFDSTEWKANCSFSESEWKKILDEAKKQAVFPIVFSCIKEYVQNCMKVSEYSEYEQLYYAFIAENIRNKHYHNETHRLLSAHGIRYVILKGQVSAMYYPVPALRSMGDVDFLIDKQNVSAAEELLLDNGYRKVTSSEQSDHHWEYKRGTESQELHWAPPGVPAEGGENIKVYTNKILDQAVLYQTENDLYYIPSKFHHGLIMLLHMANHLTSMGMGLRHLCDWLVYANQFSDEEFMEMFEIPLKEIGLWKFAQVLSKIGSLWFGCEEKDWCKDADSEICKAFLEDILSSGNFGSKDHSRGSQLNLLRDHNTRKIKKGGMLHNVMVNLNKKTKREYAFFEKYKLLLPVGWGIEIVTYLFDVITHKKNNVFAGASVKQAINRQNIYASFELFEKDED